MNNLRFYITVIFVIFCRTHILGVQTDSLTIEEIVKKNIVYTDIISEDSIKIWTNEIICDGDTIAYFKIMPYIPYYDFFQYSIHLANEYNYTKAYYNAYRILDIWYKLHDCEMDSISWNNIKFWLEWGAEAGCCCCDTILNVGFTISEEVLRHLDSINSFVFVLPVKDIQNRVIDGDLVYDSLNMDYEQFLQYRKLAVQKGINDYYIMISAYAIGTGYEGLCYREYLLYSISSSIKWQLPNSYESGIMWQLDDLYTICGVINRKKKGTNIHYTRLGHYVLEKGYKAEDGYAYMPLAELYYKGIQVIQDKEYAKKILLEKWKEKTVLIMMNNWEKDIQQNKLYEPVVPLRKSK